MARHICGAACWPCTPQGLAAFTLPDYRYVMADSVDDAVREPGNSTDVGDVTRRFVIEAAMRAYEDAGLAGLCAEGRWEAAIGAMRTTELPATHSQESDRR